MKRDTTQHSTPEGIIKWNDKTFVNTEYIRHPAGIAYLVKKTTVNVAVNNAEELKDWWETFIWGAFEKNLINHATMEQARLLYNELIHNFPNETSSTLLSGLYAYDCRGIIQPVKYFIKHKKGDFDKFYNK